MRVRPKCLYLPEDSRPQINPIIKQMGEIRRPIYIDKYIDISITAVKKDSNQEKNQEKHHENDMQKTIST